MDNVSATTNKAAWASITALGPKTRWVGRARWVVSGENRKIWTTSGVSAGIDGFLALLEEIYGEGVADEACRQMEYTRARNPGDDPWAKVYELDGVGRA